MKKKFSYILLSFAFIFFSIVIANKVSAASSFYDEIGAYTIDQEDTGTKYNFDRENEKYNYKFSYSYTIDSNSYILDNSSPVSYFYGITENTNLSYFPIDSTFGISVHARMMVYKYNYITKEFDFQSNSPSADATGNYLINNTGLYKVLTDGVDGTARVVYIIYEKEFYSSRIDNVVYNKNDKTLEIDVTIKTPKNLSSKENFNAVYVEYTGGSYSVSSTNEYYVSKVNGTKDEYNIFISVKVLTSLDQFGQDVIMNGDLRVEFDSNVITKQDCINYDLSKPTFSEINYYNQELVGWEMNKKIDYTSNSVVLPENGLAIIKIADDSSIVSATLNDVTSCQIEVEEDITIMKCLINSVNAANQVVYKIVDEYGNENVITHDVSYDNKLLDDGDDLSNYINVNGYEIVSSFASSAYSDIDMICLIYGNEFLESGKCGDKDGVTSPYHYKGNAIVVALDKARNYKTLLLEDVLFTKGYEVDDFKFNVDGNFESINITENIGDLNELVFIDSPYSIHDVYVKYGNVVEELVRDGDGKYYLPSYLEILNKKYQDSSCSTKECDKEIEVYTEYELGNVKQKASMFYTFDDTLPYITDRLNVSNITLEYGKFDINSMELKQKLYADELEVSLSDKAGVNYVGKILPVFVSYTSLDGNVRNIDNKSYDYINGVSEFGTYLLECRVKLITNISTGTNYTEDVYTKSFFINVELSDTTIPTLTLLGDSNVTIHQYDAYKDASAKCSDLSGCVVNVTYYKNEIKEENIIDEIDTKIAGKYIIRYEAVDSAGNKSFEVIRTVNVVSMDELDATSIIIIVSVVVAFALFVTLGIILERKKTKRTKEFE